MGRVLKPADDWPTYQITVGDVGCDYKTLAAAVAAASSGDVIHAYGGAGENITGKDGVRVVLYGIALGNITLAAGVNFYLGGQGSVVNVSVGIGGVLHLSEMVTVSGSRSGLTRTGNCYYLPDGEAIATYVPADESVVPVSAGDRLYHETAGLELLARDIGGTVRWHGARQAIGHGASASPLFATISSTTSTYWAAPNDSVATKVMVESISMVMYSLGAAHDPSNNYGVSLGLFNSTTSELDNTDGATGGSKEYIIAVNQLWTLPADGDNPGSYVQRATAKWTKNGAPANLRACLGAFLFSFVYE